MPARGQALTNSTGSGQATTAQKNNFPTERLGTVQPHPNELKIKQAHVSYVPSAQKNVLVMIVIFTYIVGLIFVYTV